MDLSEVCVLLVILASTLDSSAEGGPIRSFKRSLFDDLGITTPPSPFSEGESALHYQVKEELETSPPFVFEIRCADAWELVNVTGDPLPRCRPRPQLWKLCFESNPCGLNSECDVINSTRTCSCMSGYLGSPPDCRPGPAHEVCRREVCGPNSACNEFGCRCLPGFVGTPPNCAAGPALLSQCNPYPCGGFSACRASLCSCLPGYEGAPPHCRPGPETWRACFKDDFCGHNSVCTVQDRVAVCGPAMERTTHK